MENGMNKALIITGGHVEEEFVVKLLSEKAYDLIIAADHGLMAADRLNIPLDYIVGDFDSVDVSLLDKYQTTSTPVQTFPREKDKTDTQIALELALLKQVASIDIVGATGSRLDHVLANVHLLLLPLKMNVEAYILDSHNRIYLRDRSFQIERVKQHGNYVSLLPFSEEVRGLTLKGFRYPLNQIIYKAGSSLGISNEIQDQTAEIEFSEGILIVFESTD